MGKKTMIMYAIVGVNNIANSKEKTYMLTQITVEQSLIDGQINYNWQALIEYAATKARVAEIAARASKSNAVSCLNFAVKNGEVIGEPASLKRFTEDMNGNPTKHIPYVMLSRVCDRASKQVKGYRVLRVNGMTGKIDIKRVPRNDLVEYAERAIKQNQYPIQNAKYITSKKAFSAYDVDHDFMVEYIVLSRNVHDKTAQVNADIEKAAKEAALAKLNQIYTNEQLKEINLGRSSKIRWELYRNPAFSAEQMRALREGMESGVDVSRFAHPSFKAELMEMYITSSKLGIDPNGAINPEYSPQQAFRVLTAKMKGLDYAKLSNPKLSVSEMDNIMIQLEQEYWVDDGIEVQVGTIK